MDTVNYNILIIKIVSNIQYTKPGTLLGSTSESTFTLRTKDPIG